MIREANIAFTELLPEAVDLPFGINSGAGVIFGVTGGVTEAVLRYLMADQPAAKLHQIAFTGVRGLKGVKECTVDYNGMQVNIAIVNGLKNADELIEKDTVRGKAVSFCRGHGVPQWLRMRRWTALCIPQGRPAPGGRPV